MWIECNIKWEGCNRTGRSQQKIQFAVSGKDAMEHKTHNIARHNKNTIHHNTEKQKADENKAQVDRGGEAGVE